MWAAVQDWLGYLGVPVVAVGLLRADVHLVASGLSFLLAWHMVSLRFPAQRRPGRRGAP